MLNKLSAIKTILFIAVLLAGVQLLPKAYAQVVPDNPLATFIAPNTGQSYCVTLTSGDYDRNTCSAIPDSEDPTLGPYLYQRVVWEDVSTRDMTAPEKAIYITRANQQNTLDPTVKNLQKQLGDEALIPHAAFTKQKSSKDRIVLLGIYDRINGALRIVGNRIIYGQLASYEKGITLSVSNFQVHTQRTTIGPKHFDYLKSTNAWLDLGVDQKVNSGINPFERFWVDDASKVFYNINFGAAVVAMSKARELVDADVAYMMAVNYDGTQVDLNVRNAGYRVVAVAGFQSKRTEINMYYEWYRLFNHEKELGNLLGQSFSGAFCVRAPAPANHCKDFEIVSSDDSLVYLDFFDSAAGLSEPHAFPSVQSSDAETITPKTPIHQVVGNYLFLNQDNLEKGFDFSTGGSPFSVDDLFLKDELGLTDEEIETINSTFGVDTGYLINSRWLTYDFGTNVWDQRAATRADFQGLLDEEFEMNNGHAYTVAADWDPISAGSTVAVFSDIGESIYTLFIKQDDLINSDVAALACFATADDPINPTNEEWYEKGCGQVGKSENFLDSATASVNVSVYHQRAKDIRDALDDERKDAAKRDGIAKTNLPQQSTMPPDVALVELRAGTKINLTGGGEVSQSGSVITAKIGGKSYSITERQALKLFHRYPPTNAYLP